MLDHRPRVTSFLHKNSIAWIQVTPSYPINISKPLQPQNELLYIASPKFPFLFPIRTPCTHSNTLSTTYRSYINLSFNLRSGGPFSFLFWRWREKHAWYIDVTHRPACSPHIVGTLGRVQTLRINSQHYATTCNRVRKPTQHVKSNNVGSCWLTMVRPFAFAANMISSLVNNVDVNTSTLSPYGFHYFFSFCIL